MAKEKQYNLPGFDIRDLGLVLGSELIDVELEEDDHEGLHTLHLLFGNGQELEIYQDSEGRIVVHGD